MLVMSVALELYGTWIGNWVWHPDVPYFALTSNNPPLAAGSFYCMLDVLVGLTVRSIVSAPAGRAGKMATPIAEPGAVEKAASIGGRVRRSSFRLF
jgi:hypothetical protein